MLRKSEDRAHWRRYRSMVACTKRSDSKRRTCVSRHGRRTIVNYSGGSMKQKFPLAVLLVAAVVLGGCASSTKTDTPTTDQSGTSSGTGADTGSAPAQQEAVGQEIQQANGSERPAEMRIHFPFDSSNLDE